MPISISASNLSACANTLPSFPQITFPFISGTVQVHPLGWVCLCADTGLKVLKGLDEEQAGFIEVIVRNLLNRVVTKVLKVKPVNVCKMFRSLPNM